MHFFRRLLTSRLCRTFISNHDLGASEWLPGVGFCPLSRSHNSYHSYLLPQGKKKVSIWTPCCSHSHRNFRTATQTWSWGNIPSCPVLLDINVRHFTLPPSKPHHKLHQSSTNSHIMQFMNAVVYTVLVATAFAHSSHNDHADQMPLDYVKYPYQAVYPGDNEGKLTTSNISV